MLQGSLTFQTMCDAHPFSAAPTRAASNIYATVVEHHDHEQGNELSLTRKRIVIQGKRSKGYSPAQSMVMCWDTYTEAALQASICISRIMGGIHIYSDNVQGMRIGREVGLLVCKEVSKLWAAAAA